MEFDNATNVTIAGPHPAGNVGIQIHHIKPINPGEVIWTVNPQHVITIGKLFQNGYYDPDALFQLEDPDLQIHKLLRLLLVQALNHY